MLLSTQQRTNGQTDVKQQRCVSLIWIRRTKPKCWILPALLMQMQMSLVSSAESGFELPFSQTSSMEILSTFHSDAKTNLPVAAAGEYKQAPRETT